MNPEDSALGCLRLKLVIQIPCYNEERTLPATADVRVNTDADNQFDGRCIPDLLTEVVYAPFAFKEPPRLVEGGRGEINTYSCSPRIAISSTY